MVVIEAMAFGVPVVVWKEGAMPEIVDEGETGYVVDSIDAAVQAVAKCEVLDRDHIRQVFERRFSSERMVCDYEAIYAALLNRVQRLARYPKPSRFLTAHGTSAGASREVAAR